MNEFYNDTRMEEILKSIHEKLDAIIEQTTQTNGRVNSLENWRSYMAGGLAVITITLLPLIYNLIQNHIK